LPVAVTGNGLPNGDYIVLRAEIEPFFVGLDADGAPVFQTRTRVFFVGGTVGADDNGTIQTYSFATDDGANIAHAVAELLFAPWPLGLEKETSGLQPWDLQSLEAWGAEAETLNLRASLVAVDGENADALLSGALIDHGVMLPIDTLNAGQLKFQLIREPVGTIPNIPQDLFSGDAPERETLLGEPNVTKLVFKFTDRDHAFGDMTIMVKEDGAISYVEYFRARQVPIISTVNFNTASTLAEQRSQEELGGAGQFILNLSRAARELIPGNVIVVDTFADLLRVIEVKLDPLSEEVSVKVCPDYYGARRSDFVNNPGGGSSTPMEPEEDIFRGIEVPEHLLTTEELLMVVPRLRAHEQTFDAVIHFSRDNSTYTVVGNESSVAAGGVLDDPVDINDSYYQDQGPTFEIRGPDIATVLDLTGDDLNWSMGRQIVILASGDGLEICFVRKVTALSATQYRLDGLLRARYDTRRMSHAVGTEVYIVTNDELTAFDDLLLVPGEDLFVKSQPLASGGTLLLEAVAPVASVLDGKGLVPIDPESLYVAAPYVGSPSYATGDDVTLRWGYSTASSGSTGAGYQGAGSPIGAPVLKGSFVVELRTSGGTLVSTQTLTVPEVTYLNATLAAGPISENDFRVRVYHTNNGYTSDFVELLVEKI